MEVKKIYFKAFKTHRVSFDFSDEELRAARISTEQRTVLLGDTRLKPDVFLTSQADVVLILQEIIKKQIARQHDEHSTRNT